MGRKLCTVIYQNPRAGNIHNGDHLELSHYQVYISFIAIIVLLNVASLTSSLLLKVLKDRLKLYYMSIFLPFFHIFFFLILFVLQKYSYLSLDTTTFSMVYQLLLNTSIQISPP